MELRPQLWAKRKHPRRRRDREVRLARGRAARIRERQGPCVTESSVGKPGPARALPAPPRALVRAAGPRDKRKVRENVRCCCAFCTRPNPHAGFTKTRVHTEGRFQKTRRVRTGLSQSTNEFRILNKDVKPDSFPFKRQKEIQISVTGKCFCGQARVLLRWFRATL